MKHSEYSVVVVGSGAAGLYAALKISQQISLPDGVLLITKSINVYCKVVILPSTKIKSFKEVVEKLSESISSKSNLKIIIQPSSPLGEWKNINFKFKLKNSLV